MQQVEIDYKKLSARFLKVRWRVLVPLVILHAGAALAPFYFTWSAFTLFLFFWFGTGLFGVTVGYHRLLAHRAFETTRQVKVFHLAWSAISLQQGPISWVRLHRAHHAFSDTERDPHAQFWGFLYGHIGWTFLGHKHLGRSDMLKLIPNDLKFDRDLQFFEKYHYHLFVLSLVLLFLGGGLPALLWGGCFRTVFVLHATWSVNSLAHRFGYRNYETTDLSRNNWIVALITWGEGWHNNHHRFPSSARQGIRRHEIDLSWTWICILRRLGYAWNIRLPDDKAASRLQHVRPAFYLGDRRISKASGIKQPEFDRRKAFDSLKVGARK